MPGNTSMASLAADIQFDADRHEYRVAGTRWPGVTQILQPLQELEGIPRPVLEAAAAFGRNVHAACHLHNLGILDEDTLDAALLPYVQAWRLFLRDTGAIVVASELMVAHPRLQYCGTLDTICLIRGKRELVDIKSTAVMPRTVGAQTAAYAEAYEPGIRRRAVQLKPDGTYRSEVLTARADLNLFLSALNVWRFLNAA